MKILITTANGMFGGAITRALANSDVQVRAMVRKPEKFTIEAPNIEVFQGDLDDRESVVKALDGVDRVFLCTPMDDKIAQRECLVSEEAAKGGRPHIVKLYGAVEHDDDPLITQHNASIETIKALGLSWSLVSPNSVMETSILSHAPFVVEAGALFGMSGRGKVGFVALQDVAAVAAHVLSTDGHDGQNYEVTGPAAVDMYEVAEALSKAVGREIPYQDMPEEEFAAMVGQATGMSPEQLECSIICHLRCWREGKAEKVTDTYEKLMGKPPTSVEAWAKQHARAFSGD